MLTKRALIPHSHLTKDIPDVKTAEANFRLPGNVKLEDGGKDLSRRAGVRLLTLAEKCKVR